MELKRIQAILFRLYTEKSLRELFKTDLEKLQLALNLTTHEVDLLKKLTYNDLDHYAKSLLLKRYNAILRKNPRLEAVYKSKLKALFFDYAANVPIKSANCYEFDFINFNKYLNS